MTTITFDSAALGTNFLFVLLSLMVGVFAGIAGSLLSGFGSLAIGIVEAIASGGQVSRRSEASRSNGFVAVRTVIWFAMIIASFVLVTANYPWTGHIVGIFGSICLPIAVIKLISRS